MTSRALVSLAIVAAGLFAHGAADAQPKKPPPARPADKPAKPAKPGKPADKPGKPAEKPTKQAKKGPKDAYSSPLDVQLSIQRAALDNGLRVVLNVERSSPSVAVAVAYDAGAREEAQGEFGAARLAQRLMRMGSRNVARGEHERLVAARGGSSASVVTADGASYLSVLPSGELDLALWLEADRMRGLDLSQRAVEEQERLPYEHHAAGSSRLLSLVYKDFALYEHTSIGPFAALGIDPAKRFLARCYTPSRAVLVLSGDFDPAAAIASINKRFGAIPRGESAPLTEDAVPEQREERRDAITDPNASATTLHYGWAIPRTRAPDHAALAIAAMLLGRGEGARIHRRLVREKNLAASVRVHVDNRRGPDALTIEATLMRGAKVEEAQKIIDDELRAIATKAPADAEMERARRTLIADLVMGLTTNASRARLLAEHELYWGDARHVGGELPRHIGVTAEDVSRVVAQHLTPARRNVVVVRPPGDEASAPKPKEAPKKPAAAKKAPKKKP